MVEAAAETEEDVVEAAVVETEVDAEEVMEAAMEEEIVVEEEGLVEAEVEEVEAAAAVQLQCRFSGKSQH